jgi:hypothetical protein
MFDVDVVAGVVLLVGGFFLDVFIFTGAILGGDFFDGGFSGDGFFVGGRGDR